MVFALRSHLLFVATAGFILVSSAAVAQINKCVVEGKVIYSDQPCEKGHQSAVSVVPNSMDGTYLRDEAARNRREQVTQPAATTSTPVSSRASVSSSDSPECHQAREELADAERSRYMPTMIAKKNKVRVQCGSPESESTGRGTAACNQALADLESVSRGGYAPDMIAKKRVARTACGMPPDSPATVTPPAPPQPGTVFNCDAAGCNTSMGRVTRVGPGQFAGPKGVCTLTGSVLTCPQ